MNTKTQSIHLIDAFADKPFTGNPAGVCVMNSFPSEAWMQSLAMEMNQAETAFLVAEGEGFRLRWFTPAVEVELCGHATLASAHCLWETGRVPAGQVIEFYTLSGTLTAEQGEEGLIWLDFPSEMPTEKSLPPDLLRALGGTAKWMGENRMDYFVEVADEAELLALRPDFTEIARHGKRGIIATAQADREAVDYISRGFFPACGINEDPVTGSAHCALAPYWSGKLLGRNDLTGYQASRRGGTVLTGVRGDRIRLGGRAVTVLRGEVLAED